MSEEMSSLSYLVRREIHRLRIPPHRLGYQYLTYAVEKVAVNPMLVNGITKELYRETARHFGTTWTAVERNSRTAIRTGWETPEGRARLCVIAGYQAEKCPNTAAFIAFVAEYVAEIYAGYKK